MRGSGRHLVSIDDLTDADIGFLVRRGQAFAAQPNLAGEFGDDYGRLPLSGDVVGIYFRLTSTRTRTAFSAAALRLGASIINFGPHDLQTNTGETTDDTGKVMSRMLDVLVARTGGETGELLSWADQSHMSVVNAMSAAEHPTQALADLTTLLCHFGHLDDLRILYIGEGNNTAAALALALSRFSGTELELRTPPGYGLDPGIKARALGTAARNGMSIQECHDMGNPPSGFDVIYTTRWQTTGTSKKDSNWHDVFAPFQVTSELWSKNPKAVFMHDLPAHRGTEVAANVIDGPMSIVFDQAGHKMHSAMAVLEWCRNGIADDKEVTSLS